MKTACPGFLLLIFRVVCGSVFDTDNPKLP